MRSKPTLKRILDDRYCEMRNNGATHCAFTYAEIIAMLDDARSMKVQLDNMQGQLREAQQTEAALRSQLADQQRTQDSRRDYVTRLEGHNSDLQYQLQKANKERDEVTSERDKLRVVLKESAETENALRSEICNLRNWNRELSLKPAYQVCGAGGSIGTVHCNNSIDAAKAQQPSLQQLCRDKLREQLNDGSWTGTPEVRQYVVNIATYGEEIQ